MGQIRSSVFFIVCCVFLDQPLMQLPMKLLLWPLCRLIQQPMLCEIDFVHDASGCKYKQILCMIVERLEAETFWHSKRVLGMGKRKRELRTEG